MLPAAAILAAAGAVALALAHGPILIALAVVAMALAFSGLGPTLDARALETVRGNRDRYGGLRAWGSASFIVVVWVTGALIERAGAAEHVRRLRRRRCSSWRWSPSRCAER